MQDSKTLGTCPLCGQYGKLTAQHVRLVPELAGTRLMICRACHDLVTRYEDEVEKARRHLKEHPRGGA